jgi:hypothetical protein
MTRKTYQSLTYQTLSMYVLVNGQKRLVQFKGGTLKPKMNGKYITDDPQMIAALDTDSANGKMFKCIAVETNDEAKEPTEDQPVATEDPKDVIKVTGIKTAQSARDYLLQNIPDLSSTKLPNLTTIKEVAAANSIKFVDLQ